MRKIKINFKKNSIMHYNKYRSNTNKKLKKLVITAKPNSTAHNATN